MSCLFPQNNRQIFSSLKSFVMSANDAISRRIENIESTSLTIFRLSFSIGLDFRFKQNRKHLPIDGCCRFLSFFFSSKNMLFGNYAQVTKNCNLNRCIINFNLTHESRLIQNTTQNVQ